MKIKGLYVITIETDKYSHIDIALESLKAGASIIQYREKSKPLDNMIADCIAIKKICSKHNATFIVNDYFDLAMIVSADALHLGQHDTCIEEARKKFKGIIGISVSTVEEAIKARQKGADYLGVGPIFPTPTKTDAAPAIGLEGLRKIRNATTLPLIAIGSINKDNVREIYETGADGFAVISAIANSDNVYDATKELLNINAN